MKATSDRILALLLSLCAGACFAQAMDEGAAHAPEPTVSVVWVIVFLAIFVGVCTWIGIGIWRNERKNRASSQENVRP
jgi:heme/copper-type cytochrome/quinol oxidase subunit 2